MCLAARLGLRAKCQERIVNGNPNRVRAFPVVNETCDLCYPAKARAEKEEKERAAKRRREKDKLSIDSFPAFLSPCFAFFVASDFELY